MTISIPAPSISGVDFACPNCGAHAGQAWFKGYADRITGGKKAPAFLSQAKIKAELAAEQELKAKATLERLLEMAQQADTGIPYFEDVSTYIGYRVHNIHFSQCFTCSKVAVWLHHKLIYPNKRTGTAPHTDLPEEIFRDFEEARSILELSPRGAAALLRLVLQKLFVHLGESSDINPAIASLVKRGLDPIVRDALDSVRVIGNEAVHPGQMDLRDDMDTVAELFHVINFITEKMIAEPKKLKAIYDKLPPEKRAAIDARNAKALGSS
jgi:hypothetical protein